MLYPGNVNRDRRTDARVGNARNGKQEKKSYNLEYSVIGEDRPDHEPQTSRIEESLQDKYIILKNPILYRRRINRDRHTDESGDNARNENRRTKRKPNNRERTVNGGELAPSCWKSRGTPRTSGMEKIGLGGEENVGGPRSFAEACAPGPSCPTPYAFSHFTVTTRLETRATSFDVRRRRLYTLLSRNRPEDYYPTRTRPALQSLVTRQRADGISGQRRPTAHRGSSIFSTERYFLHTNPHQARPPPRSRTRSRTNG